MYRKQLLDSILIYKSSKWCSKEDLSIADQFIHFITNHKDCFERSCQPGHLTASCWLWNPDESACLFTFHKKLKKWLQLGGHADGHSNLLEVALKEAREESGIEEIIALSTDIFDLSIHFIPENPFENSHLHYDVRYLLKLKKETPLKMSLESLDLRWIKPIDFPQYNLDRSILKMEEKLLI